MIRINLIPFRKARKIENVQRQVSIFAVILAIILAGMFYYNIVLNNKIEQLDTKVSDIKTDIARVEKQAREVDRLQKALKTLKQKIKVINDLEKNRTAAVRLLENMTQMVTEQTSLSADDLENKEQKPYKRLWFTNFKAKGDHININGIALDNKTVADFMTRLEASKLYTNVNLNTLKQQKVKSMNLKSFQITCDKVSMQKDKK